MIRLALLTALTLSTCAPAHANPLSDAAIRMCDGFTQITMAHVEYGFTREETDAMVEDKITNPELAEILMKMLDFADHRSSDDPEMIRFRVEFLCIQEATAMIEAVQ